MQTNELIQPNTFTTIVHNNFKEDHNISEGDVVFVAGVKAFPISEDDMYTQRVKFFVAKTNAGIIDAEAGFFLVDPTSLKNIDPQENERLSLLNYGPDEDEEVSLN